MNKIARRDFLKVAPAAAGVAVSAMGGQAPSRPRPVADNVQYWASSQQTADMAVHVDFADLGRLHGDDKDFPRRVRAIRTV